jgi:hypothetical protein
MIPDKIIYTDGRDVTVTDSTLKVRKHSYMINGITKLSMWTIRPERWPGILLVLLGLVAIFFGWLGYVPPSMNMQTDNGIIDSNTLALWAGAGLLLIGILVLALSRERYAVRIATAEGEKNAVVSHKREYIAQIVDAMNRAFNFGHTNTTYTSDQHTATIR